jgi:transposase InsO family protein
MPFTELGAMDQKLEFVRLAQTEGANMSTLCQRFGISRTLGYRLLDRFREEGAAGLEERSRRPKTSPNRSARKTEKAVLDERAKHPAWGGRKIARVLEGRHKVAPSTVTGILHRHGIAVGQFSKPSKPFIRFEHAAPNNLWQMDFKGHVPMAKGRLHPLTVLDDHSRYSIILAACRNERTDTVKSKLIEGFEHYGLPWRIAVDNGPPWGSAGAEALTPLAIWLIEIGVKISYSRPYHPQTLGKEERFHRSLKAEALSGPPFRSYDKAQAELDRWRMIYNHERPHEALDMKPPISRYAPSTRLYIGKIESFAYSDTDLVRKVYEPGRASFKGRTVHVPKGLQGKTIAFRPAEKDGAFDLYFRHQRFKTIDFAEKK